MTAITAPNTQELPELAIPARLTSPAWEAKRTDLMVSALRDEPQAVYTWQGGPHVLLSPSYPDRPGGVRTLIPNPAEQLAGMGPSAYRHPWKGYEETLPSSRFFDGFGGNAANVTLPLLRAVLTRMKAMGMKCVRFEVGFGNGDYYNPLNLRPEKKAQVEFQAKEAKRAGLVPLWTFDSNAVLPCPALESDCVLIEPLKNGDTTAHVRPRRGEVPKAWKAGFSTGNFAAHYIWHEVVDQGDGTYRVAFKLPWNEGDFEAGHTMGCALLAWRPLSADGSEYDHETVNGIFDFILTTVDFIDTLGLRKSKTDPGFRIELCNEYSNWTFLHLPYYTGDFSPPDGSIRELVWGLVERIRSIPKYKGLRVTNGFENQSPISAASEVPPGLDAGSSHFYRSEEHRERNPERFAYENAFGVPVQDGFIPSGIVHSYGTIFSGEVPGHVVHGIAPRTLWMWGSLQGRFVRPTAEKVGSDSGHIRYDYPAAREPDGSIARVVARDFTEWGDDASSAGDEKAIYHRITKFMMGGSIVFLGKGGGYVYWFSALNYGFGFISQNPYTLPEGKTECETIFARLKSLLTSKVIKKPRAVHVSRIAENHGHVQFKGNGTTEYPDLPNRDCVFHQAWQLTDTKFALSLHVLTKDYKPDLPEETYEIDVEFDGEVPAGAKFTYRDLWKTQAVKVTPVQVDGRWYRFTLKLTDMPRFLVMDGV